MPGLIGSGVWRGPLVALGLGGALGTVSRVAVVLAALLGPCSGTAASAADLSDKLPRGEASTRHRPRRYVIIPAPPPPVYAAPPLAVAPAPPPSEHGYYGYYGFDIFGTPYEGLASANVLCLRSIATPYGYRTVNVCR